MNRWLYRAAGTVGVAGGVLLVGAGGAHADQPEQAQVPIPNVFSPTLGLPPLDAVGGPDLGVPTSELLPLGADGVVGVGVVPPLDDLASLDGQVVSLPTDPAAAARPVNASMADAGTAEIMPMPWLGDPVARALPTNLPLVGDLRTVTQLTRQVPVAGPVVTQHTDNLPVVSSLTADEVTPDPAGPAVTDPAGDPAAAAGTAVTDPAGYPAAAESAPLPATIADQLAAEHGLPPEAFGAPTAGQPEQLPAVPLLGPALDPITRMVGVGNLPSQVPVVGPLAGPVLGNLPMVGPASGVPGAPNIPGAPPASPADVSAGERPVAGEDPEYTQSA